jgi:hypothetical protein
VIALSGAAIVPRTFEDVFATCVTLVEDAIEQMAAKVPRPRAKRSSGGDLVYRYYEELAEQALVLKTVRTLSALRAGKVLLDVGLALDVGATMRILDELSSDMMFLSGPLVWSLNPEPRHKQYLTEFFQEEFDHADPVKSSQRRNRVSRRDIRAYVARTFSAGQSVNRIVEITETIDSAFSGYVHGAAVHTMDMFDGERYRVPLEHSDGPLGAVRDQYPQYLHRALMAVATAAKAIGDEQLFTDLYRAQAALFDEAGYIL